MLGRCRHVPMREFGQLHCLAWQSWLIGFAAMLFAAGPTVADAAIETPWPRHTIDDTSRGADGVRLADFNQDGRSDVLTPWEEGGLVRLYLHPGQQHVRSPWPRVDVATVADPEDAVAADIDGDGRMDVVSCSEGNTRRVHLHYANHRSEPLEFRTETLTQLPRLQWMFALPILAGATSSEQDASVVRLFLGSKNHNAGVFLLSAQNGSLRFPRPGNLRRLADAGWIMSLQAIDLNHDGRLDVLYSDRRGKTRGVHWLEQPPAVGTLQGKGDAPACWRRHTIDDSPQEFMFLRGGQWDRDAAPEIAVNTNNGFVRLLDQRHDGSWRHRDIPLPRPHRRGKAIAIGDLNNDGRADLALTSEDGLVGWIDGLDMSTRAPGVRVVNGSVGIKFDRIELLDIDADGDLDILTCEERQNLGVVWFENPTARGPHRD